MPFQLTMRRITTPVGWTSTRPVSSSADRPGEITGGHDGATSMVRPLTFERACPTGDDHVKLGRSSGAVPSHGGFRDCRIGLEPSYFDWPCFHARLRHRGVRRHGGEVLRG